MSLVITVDVEDWAQSTLDASLPLYARAERNMERVLDIAAEHHCRMTCFVLGLFAERFTQTVQRIGREGHEVASHGYGHIPAHLQSRPVFREDVRRAKALLEDLVGQHVHGYRAPFFSIGRAGPWALEVVAEEGHAYDSSVFPSSGYRNGGAGWPRCPVRVRTAGGADIVELPAATARVLGRVWPVAGGGYHRLLPWSLISRAVRTSERQTSLAVMYCHPYEFDPHEFRHIPIDVPWRVRLHQGLGRAGFEAKFRRLIDMGPCRTAVDAAMAGDWPLFELGDDRGGG